MKIENRKEIVLKKYTDPLPDNTQETNEVVFNKMKEDLGSLGELVPSSLTSGLHEEMVLPRMLRDASIGNVGLLVRLFVFYKTLCSLGLENVPAIVFRAKKIIWVIQIFFR